MIPPGLREFILRRDGSCLAYQFDRTHQCRDRWGHWHGPYDLDLMTLEHVKSDLRMGVKAEDDAEHLVTLCFRNQCQRPVKGPARLHAGVPAAHQPGEAMAAPVNLSDILTVLPQEWLASRHVGTAFLLGLAAGARIGKAAEAPAEALLAGLTYPPVPPTVVEYMSVEISRIIRSGLDGDVWGA